MSFGLSGKVFHAPFLHAHNGFELSAVVERSKKIAHHSYPGIKSYGSIEELLADGEIELVVINTPNNTHYEFALEAIKKNKHVLLEKPFTVTTDQAAHLFDESIKSNRYILPYQNRRYDSDFLSVKKVLESGRLGRLVEAHFRFDRYKPNIESKAFKESSGSGSGLLYDLGPHLLDQAFLLFGLPLDWQKSLGYFRSGTKVDDYAHIKLSYPDNFNVFITVSLLVCDPQPAFILNGTKGSYVKLRADVQEQQLLNSMSVTDSSFGIEEPPKAGVLTTVDQNGLVTQENIISDKSSYIDMFNSIYQTIRTAESYPVTREQIIKQLEILES